MYASSPRAIIGHFRLKTVQGSWNTNALGHWKRKQSHKLQMLVFARDDDKFSTSCVNRLIRVLIHRVPTHLGSAVLPWIERRHHRNFGVKLSALAGSLCTSLLYMAVTPSVENMSRLAFVNSGALPIEFECRRKSARCIII